MKKRIKKKYVDFIKQMNLETIDEVIDWISDSRDNIGIYLFLGSGFVNYVNNGVDHTWNNIANKKFNNKLNVNLFTDLIYIDFGYEKAIDNIIKEKTKYINKGLREFWDEIAIFNERTLKKKNKLKILTTNHCNTIEDYFSIHNTYHLEDLNSIETAKYSILKIHNISKNNFIYNVDSYWKIFNHPNENESYYKKLSKFFLFEFNDKKNVIFIFGSSYSELHINVLFKSINNGENKIIWIRELSSILNLNRKIFNNKIPITEIRKFHEEYKSKNHLILFFNNSYKAISSNVIFHIMHKKWVEKFSKIMTFTESWKMNNKSKLIDINEAIINDFNQKEKITELNNRMNLKDYPYLACILMRSYNDKEIIDWYFENIENTIGTEIDINWFIEISEAKFPDKYLYNELINKIINKNFNTSQIKSDLILDIIDKIEILWDNEKNWKWIIEFSINKIITIDKKGFYSTRSKFFNKINDFKKNEEVKKIDNQHLIFIKDKIQYLVKYSNINRFKLVFYIYKLSNLIKRKIDIIDLILSVYNESFVIFLSKFTFLDHLFSFNKLAIVVHSFQIYLINNKNILNQIFYDTNFDNFSFNLYIILKKSKELQKYLSKFKKSDINYFEEMLKNDLDLKNHNFFFDNYKHILNDIKNKKYSDSLKKIKRIKESSDFNKISSFEFYHFVSNIFDDIILIYIKNDLKDYAAHINKIYRKLDELISNYKKFNDNNSYDYFISYNKEFEELELNIVINIINYLIENKFTWYLNSFIHKFVFNGFLNPSFDFYYIINKKFSLIDLIKNVDKKKINFNNIFEKDKNIDLINLYYDVIHKKIEDWKDDKTIFLKYIYDVYLSKNVNCQDIKKLMPKIFNSIFFLFIKKFRVDNQFNDRIVYLFISDSIKYADSLDEFLNMYLSFNHLKYMEGHSNDYFLNFLKISFEKMERKDIKKISKIFSFYFKETNSKKTFEINFEKIEESLSFMKWMRKMYIVEEREVLSSYNDIKYFCNEIFNIIVWISRSDVEEYLIRIGNIILSILSIYKINDIKENINNDNWDQIYRLLHNLSKINIDELDEKKFIDEIKKFIIKNIK